jgi:uncharacterized membrane protein
MKTQIFCTLVYCILAAATFSSCERIVVNSAENDELIASVSNLPGREPFKLIVPTIISKCAICHTHSAWYGFGETDYVTYDLITPGTYATSKMYHRLSNAKEGEGPHNMPQGGGASFTDAEITLLKTWIDGY